MCHLTMYSANRSPEACLEELTAVADTLERINRRFLVHLSGVELDADPREYELPKNVTLVGAPDQNRRVVLQGETYDVGWEAFGHLRAQAKARLSPTEAGVIRLLSLVTKSAELPEVVAVVKGDPAIQYNLIKYLNTASVSLASFGRFRSFEQAVMLMGYRQLARWLSMYLLQSSVESSMPQLYRTSVTRGRQMELLAQACGYADSERDSVFLTGTFSLIDRILGMDMASILEPLSLDAPVASALLDNSGPYAPLLQFSKASETGTESELYGRLEMLGISAREANLALVQGMYYAAEAEGP